MYIYYYYLFTSVPITLGTVLLPTGQHFLNSIPSSLAFPGNQRNGIFGANGNELSALFFFKLIEDAKLLETRNACWLKRIKK